MYIEPIRNSFAGYSQSSTVKGTPRRAFLLKKSGNMALEAYIKGNYARSIVDQRSTTTGYYTFLGGNLVTWRSEVKSVVPVLVLKLNFLLCLNGCVNY